MSDVSMLVAEWQAEITGLRTAWEQAAAERDNAKAEIAMLQSAWRNCQRERDAAKAEVARLTKQIEIFKTVDDALEASHQQFRLDNDREWRAKLDHAKAEIARLTKQIEEFKTEREYIWGFNAGFDEATEQAKAEIARLKKELGEDDGQPPEQEEWRDYDRDC